LYTSFYRAILSKPTAIEDCGALVSAILFSEKTFSGIVQAFREVSERILLKSPLQRKGFEVNFIRGLLRQRNALTDRICKDWPSFQMAELCRKATFYRAQGLERIIEY